MNLKKKGRHWFRSTLLVLSWISTAKLFVLPVCTAATEMISNGQTAPGSGRYELIVGSEKRSFIVYQPKLSSTKKVPLMIVLHGGLGNASHIEKVSGMDQVADQGEFIVAYPDGTGGRFRRMKNMRTWNAGDCCGWAVKTGADDVLFIKKMIHIMNAEYPVDENRVYVTGMSNGAMMAYRLACEIPECIAAIVPVSGTLAFDTCDRAKDVPVLHIHGSEDENVPLNGGKGLKGISGVSHTSVFKTLDLMNRSRTPGPVRETREDGARILRYENQNGGTICLYIVEGKGHVWPGGSKDSGNKAISASLKAWEFARQFSKSVK